MKKGLHKFKKVCYDNPRWETSIAIWACSSVGRANGSILCPQIWGCSASVRQMVRIYAAKKVNKGL